MVSEYKLLKMKICWAMINSNKLRIRSIRLLKLIVEVDKQNKIKRNVL